jgi:hypothetical protein
MSVFRLQERIESHLSNEVTPRAASLFSPRLARKGIVTKRYKFGSFALSLVACPDFRFLLCAKTRQSNQGRGMALRVFNYSQVVLSDIAVNSQRFTQGEIDNFDVCVRVVVGDAILEVLNNGVIFAGNRCMKQTSLEILYPLMQNSPCPDKVMRSLETSFRFSTLRTSKSTLFGWTIALASSNERSSSKSLNSLLLIRSQYFSRAFCLASSQPQRS